MKTKKVNEEINENEMVAPGHHTRVWKFSKNHTNPIQEDVVYVLHENPEILDDPGEHLLN